MEDFVCLSWAQPQPTNQPACLPTWLPMQRWKTITLASVDANTPTTEISSPVPMYCYRCYTRISPENCLHLNEWPFWGWIFPFLSCTTSIKYRSMEKWRSLLLSVHNPYITYVYAITDPAMVHLKLDSWSKEIFQNSNRERFLIQPLPTCSLAANHWVVSTIG